MPEAFDPYHRWLGIRPEKQPADHYALLAIELFEDNLDVIESAADRQMAHLRTFQLGKHSALSQKLLNEVTSAKLCLLSPQKKAAYDQQLRRKLQAEAEIQTLPKAKLVEAAPRTAAPAGAMPNITVSTASHTRRCKTALPWQVPVLAVSLVVGAVLVYHLWPDPPAAPPARRVAALVFKLPEEERKGLALEIDGNRQTVPGTGPVEFACKPGRYRITAAREGYKRVELTFTVKPGSKEPIPLNWEPLDGTLVFRFQWPRDRLQEATLRIDGGSAVPLRPEARHAVAPDLPHTYEATLPGFETIRQTVAVETGNEKTVELVWQELPPAESALLVLDWPEPQRVEATLLIDGEAAAVPAEGPCEFPLQPGERRVVVDRPGFRRFAQTVMLAAGEPTTVKVVSTHPARISQRPDQSSPHVTIDMEKQRFAYDLQADNPLPEGELYVELWGPQWWGVPARFRVDVQHVPIDGKITLKLNSKVTIEWSQIPRAEMGVKFIALADGLKLQTESVYRERGGIKYALTPARMKDLRNTLPKNLDEKKGRLLYLQNALPAWSNTLRSLQAQLFQESSKPPQSRNPRTIAVLSGQIRQVSNDINKGRKEYVRLPAQIQKLAALVQVLPTLEHLVNNLNDSKLYYRVFSKSTDDG